MKRRIRRVVNFFAFNLLFFALYLNFIHSDKVSTGLPEQTTVRATASVVGTVPVAQPEKYLAPKADGQTAPAKLSVN